MITVTCSCGKNFHVKDSFAGKKAKCSCGTILKISDVPDPTSENAQALEKKVTEKISFSCDCGKTFNVSKKYQGKKVRCKVCQKVLTVPTFSDEPEDKQEAVQVDNGSQSIDPRLETESSEKPKRLLFICIAMLLIGAIAYGAFMFFSSQKTEIVPQKQEQATPVAVPSQPTKDETTDTDVTDEVKDLEQQESAESSSEVLTPVETSTEKDQAEPQPDKQAEKKTEKLATEPTKEDISLKKKPEIIPQIVQQTEVAPVSQAVSEPPKAPITTAAVDKKPLPPKEEEGVLRSHPMTYTRKQVIDMIQKFNFFDAQYNPNGGFPNRFVDNRNGTITDNETRLMWQKSGTREMISWSKTPEYIDRLNNRKYAGYSDWRLPTLEELLTLTKQRHSRQGLYISSFFSQKQGIVGSSDFCTYDGKKIPWYTSFLRGISNCVSYDLIDEFHVRAVRSIQKINNG
ncbi:MAG: DUF1566 domain-containing protein [Candidatus Magnetomorum sp.]|nr:DUF1566 domain-containing protein [Candidatus Magnetomorum sp.]